MKKNKDVTIKDGLAVQPADIIRGLGTANREFLALCLALFDDSTLSKRIQELIGKGRNWISRKVSGDDLKNVTQAVQTGMVSWRDSELSDRELRLILWIYLREAFGLPARLTRSSRGADVLCNELAAAAVRAADPLGLSKAIRQTRVKLGYLEPRERISSLAEVVRHTIQELTETLLGDPSEGMTSEAQDELIRMTRARLEGLDDADRRRLLDAVGADELNDAAISRILMTGGGLGAFSFGVGAAGFSAYILAAKASAFIPLISGPGLVSLVAVISNPVTVLLASGVGAWWFRASADRKIRAAVALRVVALLALQGLSVGRKATAEAIASFASIRDLKPVGEFDRAVYEAYATDWALLTEQSRIHAGAVAEDGKIRAWMDSDIAESESQRHRWRRLLFPGKDEVGTTTAISALTLGDIVFSAAAIDPSVIKAADFSRVELIDSSLDFAAFARGVLSMDGGSAGGALSNLKGYVAEQTVAASLVSQGYQVEFPSEPNQPGWDLLVDGEPYQVKCLADASSLSEHFERYPDIAVLANSELRGFVPPEFEDRVFFVEGYSQELIEDVTSASLEAGDELLSPDVPVLAMATIAARRANDLLKGRVTSLQAVEQIILDGGIRAGLAAAGGFAGAGVGLLTLGPAGALVLGSLVPILSQAQSSRVRGALDRNLGSASYRAWETRTRATMDELLAAIYAGIEGKKEILRRKYQAVGKGVLGTYVRARFLDEALYLDECQARRPCLEGQGVSTEKLALKIIQWTAGVPVHPGCYQQEMARLQAVLAERPTLAARTDELMAAGIRKAQSVAELRGNFGGGTGRKPATGASKPGGNGTGVPE